MPSHIFHTPPLFLVKRKWKWMLCRQTVTLFCYLMMVPPYRSVICKWHQYKVLVLPGVSISSDNRQNMLATLLREVGYFFPPNEEATILNNVMDKNRICSRKNIRNVVMMICSLLGGFHCVANRSKFDLKLKSSWMKLFYTQFSPLITGNRLFRVL